MKIGIDIKRDKTKYISFLKKLFFGLGNMYNGALDFFNFFYAIFLTDIIKLNPLYGGSIFLISKVWDALFVPVIANMSDRTKSKYGRRRIYFLIGIIPVFITFFLLWYPPILSTTAAKYAYVLITSILFRTVFNLVMIPYEAMRAQITQDYNERNIVNIFCLGFSIIATFLILAVPMYMTGVIENQRTVYFNTAVIFGSIFSMVWIGVFISTKGNDKYTELKKEKGRITKRFFEPLKIKSFRILAIMYVVVFLAIDIMALLYLYYMKYYMNMDVTIRSAIVIVPLIIAIIAQAGMIPLMLKVSRIQSKAIGYIISGIIWCVGGYLVFVLPPGSSKIMLGVSISLLGIGITGSLLMLNSMQGDMTDVGEFYFGEKREAAINGLMLFLRKVASAFAQFTTLTALGIAGYIKPIETQINGITQSVGQTQPNAVLFVIRIFISIIPVFFITWGVINALKYPLSCRIHDKLVKYLKNKNENGLIDELAKEDLEDKLIKPGAKEFFELVKRVWRSFYPEYKINGIENVIRNKPSVFVSNHAGTFGPVIIQIFFPFKFKPWVVSYVMSKDKCEEHLKTVFFKENVKIKAPWSKILAKVLAPLLTWLMTSAQAIPVYRSNRKVITTFNKSVKALREGSNIMLFPENASTTFSENIHDFYNGFVNIAKKHFTETGEEIEFYPVYIEQKKYIITIGEYIKYDSLRNFKEERDRITFYLRDYIDNLANIQKEKDR